jgi:DNA polymerase III subunit gamma/tau
MNSTVLNLARKWRSKNFDQIVGQDLSVRMLKNSLYKDYFFPVYLFSGQRGCGKTSTARIFGAAVNCDQLPLFQKDPKSHTIPCLACDSCRAMATQDHPDFIEMDAASHTGVDNIRHLVDTATLLPVMGRKKIYLIDEAHMLSRAAFNAFLKILEEPPASVLFILATTDPEKIIETVRSRCFQLFFRAVKPKVLVEHLAQVCAQERIRCDHDALELIVRETEGSVRDALNVIEQVRFSTGMISKRTVFEVLGYLDNERMLELFQIVIQGNLPSLFAFLERVQLHHFSPVFIWRRVGEILRAALWARYGVAHHQFGESMSLLHKLASARTVAHLNDMLEHLYTQEQIFLKTTEQHAFLEMVLLQLCQKNRDTGSGGTPVSQAPVSTGSAEYTVYDSDAHAEEDEDSDDDSSDDEACSKEWTKFLALLESLHDPLTLSLFTRASCKKSGDAGKLVIVLPENQKFFQDHIDETRTQWYPLFEQAFGTSAPLEISFVKVEDTTTRPLKVQAVKQADTSSAPVHPRVAAPAVARQGAKKTFSATKKAFDFSDKEKWKTAHLILSYFPSVITELEQEARS